MAQNDVGVTKLENGNWEYRFVMVVDGKKVTSRKRKDEQGNPLTTKRAALKARKEAMKKAQLGITNTAPTAKKTVEEVYREYCEKGRGGKAYATIRKQDSLWDNHLCARFGHRYIDEISVAEIVDYGIIEINLCYDKVAQELVQLLRSAEKPSSIDVIFRDYDPQNIVREQESFSEFTNHLFAEIISIMFPIPSEWAKIEKMIKNDAAFVRSGVFANSLFFGMESLGKDAFHYPALVHDYPCLDMIRKQNSPITSVPKQKYAETPKSPKDIVFDSPPYSDFSQISNADIYTSPIINNQMWNQAHWKGVMFMAYREHYIPPILSFMFETDNGKAIWKDWRKLIGEVDVHKQLEIRIIKGIDRKHPHWYRVAIGSNGFSNKNGEDACIISLPARLHTMQPSSNDNLRMFENELAKHNYFFLCPAYMPDRAREPSVYTELGIKMRRDSIIICDASDVLANDHLSVCAILPSDDPIIPKGKENAPITDILRRKT